MAERNVKGYGPHASDEHGGPTPAHDPRIPYERLTFGQQRPCPLCKLDGMRHTPMTADQQRRRNRELRIAKRKGVSPPPLDKTCNECGGRGYI
jgi:hypothetical protein